MRGSRILICRMIIWEKILLKGCFCLKSGWIPLDKKAAFVYTFYIKII